MTKEKQFFVIIEIKFQHSSLMLSIPGLKQPFKILEFFPIILKRDIRVISVQLEQALSFNLLTVE